MMRTFAVLLGFHRLPFPARAGMMVATGGVGVGLIYFFTQATHWVVGGAIAAILFVIIYELVRKIRQRKKGESFTESLRSMLRMQPRNASPEERGRLEQMREKFDEGMEKFRAAGRTVYDVPWYLMIGEPGSGKTEAIRRSNIAFPPGLQDRFQGAGGTVNMDWWFTNDAVIIDTAGRIIVEEVAAGEVAEWDQLLTMLKGQRKKCPINGVLLMLPAAAPPVEEGQAPATGGLLDDSSEQIEQRATRFVERLSKLQARLGVRYPVFIVVTMCDRVMGFREFFDNLTDVEQQHQMLGWSNPAPLDEPYNSDAVAGALRDVAGRLRRRRLELLRDPIHTEDASKRRADQVDGLFAFPEAFDKLTPNLRAYLDRLFTKTSWYQPPFFRGVYFTSSMQKGEAIDTALAELVGVNPEELEGGGVFRADRAYFLKDTIEKKVFQESGLVTDAADAEGHRRKAMKVMWIAGGAAAALLFLSMILGVVCTRSWKAANLEPWSLAREAYHFSRADGYAFNPRRTALQAESPGAAPAYVVLPAGQDRFGGSNLEIQRRLLNRLEGAEAGFMCRLFGGGFDADTSRAQSVLFARVVTRPAVDFAAARLEADQRRSTETTALDAEARAVTEMLRWSTLALNATPSQSGDAGGPRVDFGRVAAVVDVTGDTDADWRRDAQGYAEVFDETASRLAREGDGRLAQWLHFALGLDQGDRRRAQIARMVDNVVAQHRDRPDDMSSYGRLAALDEAMTRYLEVERQLWTLAADQRAAATRADADRMRLAWLRRHDELKEQHDRVVELLAPLRQAAGDQGVGRDFARRAVNDRRTAAENAFDRMLGALPPAPEADAPRAAVGDDRAWLESLRAAIAGRRAEFSENFSGRADTLLARVSEWSAHVRPMGEDRRAPVERRFDVYRLATERLLDEAQPDRPVALTTLAGLLSADARDRELRQARASELLAPLNESESAELRSAAASARQAAGVGADLAGALRQQVWVDQAFTAGWPTLDQLRAAFAEPRETIPALELSVIEANPALANVRPEFSVAASGALAGAVGGVQDALGAGAPSASAGGASDQPPLFDRDAARQRLRTIEPELNAYVRDYSDYWSDLLDQSVGVRAYESWADFRNDSQNRVRPFDARESLASIRSTFTGASAPLARLHAGDEGVGPGARLLARIESARAAEQALMREYPLDVQLRMVIDYMRTLPSDALEARSRMLRDLAQGTAPLLAFLRNAQQNLAGREYLFETRYTIELLAGGLDAARSETRALLVGRYNAFSQAHQNQFPFAPLPDNAAPDQAPVADASVLGDFGGIDALVGASSTNSAEAFAAYPNRLRDAAMSLENLLGDAERTRARRLYDLKTALAGPGRSGVNLTCSVVLLGQQNIDRPFNVNYLRVNQPGATNRAQAFLGVEDTTYTDLRSGNPFRFRASDALNIDLLTTETDAQPLSAVRLGEWSALKLLHVYDATPVGAPDEPATEWDVRIPVGDNGRVHLRLVFERPLPPLAQWPRF